MTDALQASLLDLCEQPGPGPLGSSVRRAQLGRGAWIDLRPGWLGGADELFSRLRHAVPWRAERRQMYDRVVAVPRLLCFYGEDQRLPDPVLEDEDRQAGRAADQRSVPAARSPLTSGLPLPPSSGPGQPGRRSAGSTA